MFLNSVFRILQNNCARQSFGLVNRSSYGHGSRLFCSSTSSPTPTPANGENAEPETVDVIHDFNWAKTLELKFNTTPTEKSEMSLNQVWLRHHCRCDKCFNQSTQQRITIPAYLPTLAFVYDVTLLPNRQDIQVVWEDEHVSVFNLQWLKDHHPLETPMKWPRQPVLPTPPEMLEKSKSGRLEAFPEELLCHSVKYDELVDPKSDQGVSELLKRIVQHGFGVVVGCPPNLEGTRNALQRISHPVNTLFGDVAQWSNDSTHKDTAYTSEYIHLHTDTTYFSEPMGLQMLHCIGHDGKGGLNSIVDGFTVARSLRPELYAALSQTVVPWQYMDPGKHHFRSEDTVLRHDPVTGKLVQIRYNPHDLAILNTVSTDELPRFYEALADLSSRIESIPTFFRLIPGSVIFIDNWRMLHGRDEFTGNRTMIGGYISRSDWLSRARTLGLV